MAVTDRLTLPLLSAAQAQKEVTHNEALALIDAAVHPVVVAVAPVTAPAAPNPGQCWIVGVGASGAWAGQEGKLAAWTVGGWRFATVPEGASAWSLADGCAARRTATGWSIGVLATQKVTVGGMQVLGARQSAISTPAGGAMVDGEARAAIAAVLAALRGHGLIAQ